MKRLFLLGFAAALLGIGSCFDDREPSSGDGDVKPFQMRQKDKDTTQMAAPAGTADSIK